MIIFMFIACRGERKERKKHVKEANTQWSMNFQKINEFLAYLIVKKTDTSGKRKVN